MTSLTTECTPKSYPFGRLEGRPIVTDFQGAAMTQDGGLILVSMLDRQLGVSERMAACFTDQRDGRYVQHELKDLMAQRLYGLVQGYEDLNDHDQLRHDELFGIAIGKRSSSHERCAPLAGKSTLNRLEQAMQVPMDLSQKRYQKYNLDPTALADLLVTLFLEQHPQPPKQIILDLDVTNDEVHGQQMETAFNGYYQQTCYTPLLIFCGRFLLSSRLRPSNVDPAAGAIEELQRIIPQIRQQWPMVEIVVRGDSAYSREEIMAWCESQEQVAYVFAHASNERLRAQTWHLEERAKAAYEASRAKIAAELTARLGDTPEALADLDALVPAQVFYQSLNYQTTDSWSRERRLVCKLTYDGKVRRHFIVSSWTAAEIYPAKLHGEFYCPRGEMENRIKEHQLDLFSDRTSTHEFESNQLRLWFSSFAYVLMQALRQTLENTELAVAQCGTIRLKLLKIPAQIRVSARRILISFSHAWSGQSCFETVYRRLSGRTAPG